MSGPPYKRSPRTVQVGDHLWQLLEAMANEMSADRDTLVNQALFAFARANGYLAPGELAKPGSNLPQLTPQPVAKAVKPDGAEGMTAQLGRLGERGNGRGAPGPAPEAKPPKRTPTEEEWRAAPAAQSLPDADPDRTGGVPSLAPEVDYLPDDVTGAKLKPLDGPAQREDFTHVGKDERKLFIHVEGKGPQEIKGNRFVIGRDQATCQLTLASTRISRQHAQVLRDSTGTVLEDLGSSNGTWFNKERIARRPVQNGDEYTIGDVKVRFEFR